MLIKLYEANPNENEVRKIVELLKKGAVIVLPTDGVYAFACDMFQPMAVETIIRIKKKDFKKANLSVLCDSIALMSEYAKMNDWVFKLLKRNLPGRFTFILPGSAKLPKLFKNRKTIGVRMPENKIALAIVRELGNPLMTSSVFMNELTSEYYTDPELIEELFGDKIQLVVDGGYGYLEPSTIVDCTGDLPEIVRQGAGQLID